MILQKLLLGSLGVALTVPALAQTERGARFIGVNVGNLNYTNDQRVQAFSASLLSSGGVFVADNLLMGVGTQLGCSRSTLTNYGVKSVTSNVTYGLAPFARYYLPGTSRHRLFGQLNTGVRWNSQKFSHESTVLREFTSRSFTYGAALGYNYFLSPNAALEVLAGYNRYESNYAKKWAGALDIRAGFSLFLPSRKAAATPAN